MPPSHKIITASPDSAGIYLGKIWGFRNLILAFALKDIKVRFAQTWLRVGWIILQPLTGTVLFAFFFGYILHWQTGNLPFTLYTLSGLLGWNLFSGILLHGTGSLHDSSALIRKIYFPRLIMPLSKLLVALLETGISFLLLIPLMIVYGVQPTWRIVFLPLVLLLNMLTAICLVCWIGAFSYKTRDLLHLTPFITYFGIWITPVFFTYDILPEQLRFIWFLNPMAGVVDGWRSCLFAGWEFNTSYLPSMLAVLPVTFGGLWIYCRKESQFSDFI